MTLDELNIGEIAYIHRINGSGKFKRRLIELGFTKGTEIQLLRKNIFDDPIVIRIYNSEIFIRKTEAKLIEVIREKDIVDELLFNDKYSNYEITETNIKSLLQKKIKTIKVLLIGNPNIGKTSFFNYCTGLKGKVANYPGVTLEVKKGTFSFSGYSFEIIDLPGVYSLLSNVAEEKFVKDFILNKEYDIILNIVEANNLERSLYVTTQLIDLDIPFIIVLNMYDRLKKSGNKLDFKKFTEITGVPVVPTVASKGYGITNVFKKIIEMHKTITSNKIFKHIHINYGDEIEKAIKNIQNTIKKDNYLYERYSSRFISLGLLENDEYIKNLVNNYKLGDEILTQTNLEISNLKKININPEIDIPNKRHEFIKFILKNTNKSLKDKKLGFSNKIDNIVLNKYLGIPIFLLTFFIFFELTFKIGEYPVQVISYFFEFIKKLISINIKSPIIIDFINNGILSGFLSVIVYLPNLFILFFFLAFLEDIGYLTRVNYITDKLMHTFNLHGKSTIPLFLGFGCSVPAIISTRTIDTRIDRLITMIIIPLIPCSSRLPSLVLLISILFPKNQGMMLFILYVFSVLTALTVGFILKKFSTKKEEIHFMMELPPYAFPSLRKILYEVWYKIHYFLKRIFLLIVIASIIIWFLKIFPLNEKRKYMLLKYYSEKKEDQLEKLNKAILETSYLAYIGKFFETITSPMGIDWKLSLPLVTGLVGKELIVSTLGTIFSEYPNIKIALIQQKNNYPPPTLLAYLFFILLYTPCIGTLITIYKESKITKYAIFSFFISLFVAWIVAFLVYNISKIFFYNIN